MTDSKVATDEMVQERVMLSSLQARIPPKQITVLPNGEQVLFLGPNYNHKSGHLSLQIINLFNNEKNEWGQAFDFSAVANLSTELSLEQKLLRERTRTSAHGITSYSFHKQTNQILFQYGPHLLLSQIPRQKMNQFNSIPVIKIGDPSYDKIGTRMDSNLTNDGSWIIFTRNDDLWMTTSRPNYLSSKMNHDIDIDETASARAGEIQLTFAQNISKDITAGVADFINQEEFDRFTGYWLSPNYNDFILNDISYREYSILYLEADNSNVPTITIPSMDGIEQHKWPRAGETNCSFKVKMVTFSVPISCCADLDIIINDEVKNDLENISENKIIINDYELKQAIYSSYSWIEYIVRAGWTTRPNECWIQYLDRKQMRTNVVLYKFDKHFVNCKESDDNKTQESEESEETDVDNILCGDELLHLYGTPWINITDTYFFMDQGLIWCSEHTGYKHLYFIPYPMKENEKIDGIDYTFGEVNDEKVDATQVNMTFLTPSSCNVQVLTSGRWEVEGEAIWFDNKTNIVYFQGRRETHLESHLYCVQFDPSMVEAYNYNYKINKLTKAGYFHSPNVDSINFKFFSSIYSSISSTRHFAIYSIDGKCIKEFDIPHRGTPNKIKYVSPQIVNIENFPTNATQQDKLDDDYKNLYTFSAVIYPPLILDTDEKKKDGYPTIIYVYGGPHAQLVINSFDRVAGNARCQLWRSLGYTVAIMDSRGSNHRGLAFEGRMKYKMGQIEIEDQVKLVEYLVANGWTNPSKVGITGYSYGGYLSLMALCQRPDIFTCCIAGAPVTLWQLYDTGYTERYMGTPQQNKHGYDNGSVLKYVKKFPDEEGRVVIIHGLGDENVHFYHTSKLINAMVKVGKPYQLKIFPGERHGIRQWDNVIYMEKYYISHFSKMLQ